MGRSNNFARVGLACSAHLGGNTLRDLVGHIRTTVSRPLRKISSYLPIIIAVCCIPKLASLVSASPAPSCSFVSCVLVLLLGIKSIWYGLPSGFNLQPSHYRGRNCKSTQLGTQAENPSPNMLLLSALRSCGINLHPRIAPEQVGSAHDLSGTDSASPAAPPVTSSEILSESLRCDDPEALLDTTVLAMAAPQAHATQFMRLESLNTEGGVLVNMAKGIAHVQPRVAHNHDATPKLCSNTTDPIPNFTILNRFGPRVNIKPSERWISAQLLCLAVLSNLGRRCVQRKSFWATLRKIIKLSELPREPKKHRHFSIPPSRPSTVRSSPYRLVPRIGKIFVLGSLFLYALSSGTGSSGYFGFGGSGGSGPSPNDTSPGSQSENDWWSRFDPYAEISPILDDLGPQGTAGTDDISIHRPGTLAGTIHIIIHPPTPEQVDSGQSPPPPLVWNAPQGGAEPHAGRVSHVVPTQGYTPSPQPGPMRNYGTQTTHHPPAPQPPFHAPPSQMPPQPSPHGAELYAPVSQAHSPSIRNFQRLTTDPARNPHQGRSIGTSVPLGDAGPDHLRQWVSILGQPDPPLQPDLDERAQRTYSRGYADAWNDLITRLVAAAQANSQLAQAEPSTHAQEEGEVAVSLLPATPTPQSDQVVSNPNPPTVAQEVSNKPESEPYAPPTPPCDNTDTGPFSQNFDTNVDPTIDSQAPHQESVPDAQNVDHHTPETIHAPQPVAPAPAPTSSLVPPTPYPSLPTPAATPITQGENNKPHVCSICGAAYPRPYLLRDHMTSKHGNATEKPYACDFEGCDSRFSTRSNMRKHFKQKHRGSGTPYGNGANQAGPSS